ncbi:MAG: PspC domain-containing protein [Candidatus Omnitrophota bacterium]|nr:PspC domain-containing protein [Candidatus Omnitrophota bacterium]MBU1928335.1 PspC domain-containing protein [Candidatus Omnitrophota bacterium]MBU2034349.1 PspC domain-containing protein [Candidatus Omnitrophota bacterium]MBU2222337.1 PspC domain-containing protein [Candidatus Omnitrophota bacterium]MBU2258123.1 PspC domain-containing protein [Candidatus Omnitrophota bacterium]
MKKLFLSNTDRKIGGVCGGLGEYYEIDSTIFRIIFILVAVLSFGLGIVVYLAVWAVIPRKPKT